MTDSLRDAYERSLILEALRALGASLGSEADLVTIQVGRVTGSAPTIQEAFTWLCIGMGQALKPKAEE